MLPISQESAEAHPKIYLPVFTFVGAALNAQCKHAWRTRLSTVVTS